MAIIKTQHLEIPTDWPKTGIYTGDLAPYAGKPIDLARVEELLPIPERDLVVVDIPGEGPFRPWRGCAVIERDSETGAIVGGSW